LQKRLGASVWAQCRSWYRMDNGKVFALFPGFTKEYVAAVRTPDFSAYAFDVEFDVALADSFADASVHAPARSPADTPARSLSANGAAAQTAPAQTAAAHSAARPSSLIAAPDARDAVGASAPASAAADATVTAKAAV
jgi:hypothetical protein